MEGDSTRKDMIRHAYSAAHTAKPCCLMSPVQGTDSPETRLLTALAMDKAKIFTLGNVK